MEKIGEKDGYTYYVEIHKYLNMDHSLYSLWRVSSCIRQPIRPQWFAFELMRNKFTLDEIALMLNNLTKVIYEFGKEIEYVNKSYDKCKETVLSLEKIPF